MVEEDVAGAKGLEELVRVARQVELDRCVLGELEVRPVDDVVYGDDAVEVNRSVGEVDLVFVEPELPSQEGHQPLRGAGLDLQADRVSLAPVLQGFGDLLEQVVRLFLVDVELTVAGDAESRPPGHLVPFEELAEIVGDDSGEGHEVHRIPVGVGQPQNPRQDPRNGNDADGGGAVRLKHHPVAESLVEDPWKGVGGIDCDRGEDRFQLFLPVALDEGALLTAEVMDFPQVDPLV